LVNFIGPEGSFQRVSALDILNASPASPSLKGKLALIGGTWDSANDLHLVPTLTPNRPRSDYMTGIELQANCIATLLNPNAPIPASLLFNVGILALTIVCVSFVIIGFYSIRRSALTLYAPVGIGVSLVWGIGWILLSSLIFTRMGLLVRVTPPLLAIVLANLGSAYLLDGYYRRLRRHFGRYVGIELVNRIADMSDFEIGRMGRERTVTLLFSDIRNYTEFSSEKTPTEVVRFLNAYFEKMVAVALERHGFVDKYIGDGLLVVFGMFEPEETVQEWALEAVRAAIGMKKALIELRGSDESFRGISIGIGIHTGTVVVGDIGTRRKSEFTVIGSAANLASRIESETKPIFVERCQKGESPPAVILLSESTQRYVESRFATVSTGHVPIRGLKEEVTLFELLDEKEGGPASD
jgi:adenylate cyclase